MKWNSRLDNENKKEEENWKIKTFSFLPFIYFLLSHSLISLEIFFCVAGAFLFPFAFWLHFRFYFPLIFQNENEKFFLWCQCPLVYAFLYKWKFWESNCLCFSWIFCCVCNDLSLLCLPSVGCSVISCFLL